MTNSWIETLKSKFFTASVEELDIDGTIALKYDHIPKRLFKYREVNEFSLSNLRDKSLYCAFASSFNDPYDSSLVFDPYFGKNYTSQLAKQLIEKTELNDTDIAFIYETDDPLKSLITLYYKQFPDTAFSSESEIDKLVSFLQTRKEKINASLISDLNSKIQNMYKICSLSERLDSLLMWSHYGNEHKGFVMEYDFSSLPIGDLMGRCLWPVLYTEQIYDASEILANIESPDKSFNNMVAIISALHKAKDWDYEKEWRVIIPDSPASPPQNFRAPLKAIYLGSRIKSSDAFKVFKEASNQNIPVFKMQLSQNEFKMIAIPYVEPEQK